MRHINTICKIMKELEPIVYKHVRECDCYSQEYCLSRLQNFKNKKITEKQPKKIHV